MNIRAHHLLCVKYFKGKGYSKEFVANFYKVIKKLGDNPIIRVVNYPGIICGSCPHNVGNKCVKKGPDSEIKVMKKDNKIMEHLGIKLNQEINFAKASNLINQKLDGVREICEDCEWQNYCN